MVGMDQDKMIAFVAGCDEPDKLRTIIDNARKRGAGRLADAAFRRLIAILPEEKPGSLEHDFWQTIHAFEHLLTEERGKTTRLSRTRQKVARVGVRQTLADWAVATQETEGFRMLLERGMPELSGEAVVLRNADQFTPEMVAAARARLEAAGIDPDGLPARVS